MGDDLDKETESLIEVIDVSIESRHRGGGVMDVGVEYNAEFWPIEHPVEPPDEDQPVKCPMPDSSIIKDAQMWSSYSPRKRADISATMTKEEMVVVTGERPPARTLRKRHHTRTHHGGNDTLTPLLRMPPLHPLPTHNITIFQMLQQFNKFES
ncbi:uncharacterized protein LOC130791539 isoform X2 [Actinidia eriantha]|uniref:uncharacterized protein LOC130791539 isoform X2 n=1 Tax=Actinidia eriantha TaxID=165200 RepID=UPI002582FDBA|nr:uncharacterized protein LOC130791539 isoform X2 [Actinidia eriantha]